MSDNITMTAPSLSDFLARIGLPQAARDRVIAIDQKLADALASDDPDANGCADLVLEAADLIADLDPPGFDWKGWADDPGDDDGFDFDAIEWGEE
ncbi:hypothetical protein [Shinella pollutisoli]|uniref:Uncharacterized protein n=1 Tax=Shinella pollutisoli TaxID=2250594 RepID=A0ABV7DET8_9HYPH|nr:hypothetical protein [Shinella pollutisoli]